MTGASVYLGTVGDTYFFGGIALSTPIRDPNLGITKTVDHANASPGDVVTYSTTVTNPAMRSPAGPFAPRSGSSAKQRPGRSA